MDYENLAVNYTAWVEQWMPWIRTKLGFRDDDREIITDLIAQGVDNRDRINLEKLILGTKAIIFGAGPVLTDHIELIRQVSNKVTIVAADGATIELRANGIIPDLVLTDLDGIDSQIIEELDKTTFIVLAHGDNRSKISQLLSYFDEIPDNIIWATQGYKLGNWCNTLGFTDGDRAICSVRNFDHALILGFDFKSGLTGKVSKPFYNEHTPLTELKSAKLEIAQNVIKWLSKDIRIYTLDNDLCPGIVIKIRDFFSL